MKVEVEVTITRETRCFAERSGEGYWMCDVIGGCEDCQDLARDAEDDVLLADWAEEADRLE